MNRNDQRACDAKQPGLIIGAALTALFLGALDALVMSAAMPTIISDLGGLSLYAWVYSAYFLSRTVSLPVFGKLSDIYGTRGLMLVSIAVFTLASLAAGAAPSMGFLVAARVFQGIGAGGIFALVYVVLSDVAPPGQRGKTLSLASSVWGISSVIGPTLGGFIVTFFSWRWIFFMNLPLGLLSFAGIAFFFREPGARSGRAKVDWAGITCFSGAVLAGLILIMTGGREIPWGSGPGIFLALATLVLAAGFVRAERSARDPFFNFAFLRYPGFSLGCAITFGASFCIFAMFAYAPLFLQGALGRTPMVVGYAMLFLSLGWSLGSLAMGRVVHRISKKRITLAGAGLMAGGCALCLGFSGETSLARCFAVFLVIGTGMGFTTLSTLLIVQDSLGPEHLGMATSLHQFARTLGGTVGVGICGGVVTARLFQGVGKGVLAPGVRETLGDNLTRLFSPGFRDLVDPQTLALLTSSVLSGVWAAFAVATAVSLIILVLSVFLPKPVKG